MINKMSDLLWQELNQEGHQGARREAQHPADHLAADQMTRPIHQDRSKDGQVYMTHTTGPAPKHRLKDQREHKKNLREHNHKLNKTRREQEARRKA